MTANALGQWLLILALIGLIPFTYWRLITRGSAHWSLRLSSYLGIAMLGALIGAVLLGLKLITIHWISFVIVVCALLHHSALNHLTARAKKRDTQQGVPADRSRPAGEPGG